jgi:hypothetical protein
MEQMNITSVKYKPAHPITGKPSKGLIAVIDGEQVSIPADPANRHYAEIMRQVEDGSLVIEPAEGEQGE